LGGPARRAQNPRTLEKVDVPAKRVVKFKVGRLMRERVCDDPPVRPRPAPAPQARPEARPPEPPPPKPPASNSPF
jgi:hypothetical protein